MCERLPHVTGFGHMRAAGFEEVMENSWGLAPCGMVRVTKERTGIYWWRCNLWRCKHIGDARAMEWPPRTAAALALSQHEPISHAMCAMKGRARVAELPKSFGAQNIEWIADIGYWIIYTVGVVLLWLSAVCFPVIGSKNISIIFFLFYKSPQLRDFGLLRTHWAFQENMDFLKCWKFKDCGTFKVMLYFIL